MLIQRLGYVDMMYFVMFYKKIGVEGEGKNKILKIAQLVNKGH